MFTRAQMMSTVEKPQKDSIREGWKMNETELQQSIKSI
ncbi:SMIM4 isoform 5 [Pan troglodytes]|uniref:Ubiquinol-cytochrome c reductase complex assembly factor 5 n=3 Tax=Hominidae TaxID=9604 RepID=F8W7Q2_HUMAN|nr:SMIM4 isoform 5 [Pan troglodytes]